MDKNLHLADVIRNQLTVAVGQVYYYPNVPGKVIQNAAKTFNHSLDENTIVAVSDTSPFGNGGEGIVFTSTGVYYKGPFEPVSYFNYSDIGGMWIEAPLFGGENSQQAILFVGCNDNTGTKITNWGYRKRNLLNTLKALQEADQISRRKAIEEEGLDQ